MEVGVPSVFYQLIVRNAKANPTAYLVMPGPRTVPRFQAYLPREDERKTGLVQQRWYCYDNI